MNKDIVLRKTAKGLHEIKTRTKDLTPQMRLVLIMVNGELSYDELHIKLDGMTSFNSDALLEKTLDQLNELGLVTDTNKKAERLRSKYGKHSWSEEKIIKVKTQMIKITEKMINKHSDKIINKINKSPNTMEGLAESIEKSEKVVKLFVGEDLAKELTKQWHAIIKLEREGITVNFSH